MDPTLRVEVRPGALKQQHASEKLTSRPGDGEQERQQQQRCCRDGSELMMIVSVTV